MADTRTIAVMTGDLVGSTALGTERISRAFAALEDSATRQEQWHGAPLRFTRHRGDGWQVVLARPEMALRSALTFRAALKAADAGFDCYLAIAQGPAPTHLSDDLNDQSEDVFVRSGQALDAIKSMNSGQRMTNGGSGAQDAAAILADLVSQGWTQAQAAAMNLALDPDGAIFTEIGRELGKSRQAVTKAALSAGFPHIPTALKALESEALHG